MRPFQMLTIVISCLVFIIRSMDGLYIYTPYKFIYLWGLDSKAYFNDDDDDDKFMAHYKNSPWHPREASATSNINPVPTILHTQSQFKMKLAMAAAVLSATALAAPSLDTRQSRSFQISNMNGITSVGQTASNTVKLDLHDSVYNVDTACSIEWWVNDEWMHLSPHVHGNVYMTNDA